MIDDTSEEFIKRHIGTSKKDQSKILDYLGNESLDNLIKSTVPEKKFYLKKNLKLTIHFQKARL